MRNSGLSSVKRNRDRSYRSSRSRKKFKEGQEPLPTQKRVQKKSSRLDEDCRNAPREDVSGFLHGAMDVPRREVGRSTEASGGEEDVVHRGTVVLGEGKILPPPNWDSRTSRQSVSKGSTTSVPRSSSPEEESKRTGRRPLRCLREQGSDSVTPQEISLVLLVQDEDRESPERAHSGN
ncbi:hypothetical protein NDU88_004102 [Pleurodeles waltl]|uniref:Uncharacterized protein n=1 Tax=Pleurodeles waltl TaxID=8319 RepID=A0AAV7PER9_PLEWA|nr:hypothetical protein NDU88_004102 [Pleurodeles waltl]